MLAFALQAVAAFNLVCTGTQMSGPQTHFFDAAARGEPFSVTYRVDLDARRYCADDCAATQAIASITDTEIVFRAERTGREHGTIVRLDRASAAYSSFTLAGETLTSVAAHCRREPFTGFPQRRF